MDPECITGRSAPWGLWYRRSTRAMHKLLIPTVQDDVGKTMLNVGNEWHGPLPLSQAGAPGPDPLESTVVEENLKEDR